MWGFPRFWAFNDQSTKRAKELWPLERAFLIGCFLKGLVFSCPVNDIGWVVVSLCESFHVCDTGVTTVTSASFSGFKAMVKISHISGLIGKLCLTLANPLGCSLPGSLAHGISQTRFLESVAISSSKISGSEQKSWIHTSWPFWGLKTLILNILF